MRLAYFLLISLSALPLQLNAAWQGKHILSLSGMQQPSAVAVADTGEILVLDGVAAEIVVFDHNGKRKRVIQAPPQSPMKLPMDMVMADGNIAVSDTGNHRILLFSLAGVLLQTINLPDAEADELSELVASGTDSETKPAQAPELIIIKNKAEPTGITYQQNTFYWSDRRNHRVCRTYLDESKITRCWGSHGRRTDQFRYPFMLASDHEDYLYVVDVLNARIQVFNQRGKGFGSISGFGVAHGSLLRPNGITSNDTGWLFVSGNYRGTISTFDNRRYAGELMGADAEIIKFQQPVGLTFKDDRLYVVEMEKGRVQVLQLGKLSEQTDLPVSPNKGAAKTSRQDCITCHLEWSDDYRPSRESKVPAVAARKMCMSCHHGAVIDSRESMNKGGQHPDYNHPQKDKQFTPVDERNAPIDKRLPLLENSTPYCGSCHTPHAQHENDLHTLTAGINPLHKNSWMRLDNTQGQLCESCHDDHKTSRSAGKDKSGINHPVGIYLQKPPHKNAKGYASDKQLHNGLPEILKTAGGKIAEGKTANRDAMRCESCHLLHGAKDKNLLLLNEKTLCAACHSKQNSKDKKEARKKGVHPVNFKLDEPIKFKEKTIHEIKCQTCHSVHNGKPDTASLVSDNANHLCANCHERQHADNLEQARKKSIHPVNIKLEEPVKVAGKQIDKLRCLSCHSVHNGKPDTPALVEEHKDGKLCKNCHEDEIDVIYSDHNLLKIAPDSQNLNKEKPVQAGVCGSCHSLHNAPESAVKLFAGADAELVDSTVLQRDKSCFACHRDKGIARDKQLEHYTHPHRDLVLKSNSERFPLIDQFGNTEPEGQIACITCHDPHRWTPKSMSQTEQVPSEYSLKKVENEEGTVLNSFLRSFGPQGSFCVDCHGIETQIRFKYYHDERARPGYADYIK